MKKHIAVPLLLITAAIMYFSVGLIIKQTETYQPQHTITFDEVEELVSNYEQLKTNDMLAPTDLKGEIFQAREVADLLEQDGCTQLYIARGAHKDGSEVSVLYGLREDNTVIKGLALQKAAPCPPYCGGGINTAYTIHNEILKRYLANK